MQEAPLQVLFFVSTQKIVPDPDKFQSMEKLSFLAFRDKIIEIISDFFIMRITNGRH